MKKLIPIVFAMAGAYFALAQLDATHEPPRDFAPADEAARRSDERAEEASADGRRGARDESSPRDEASGTDPIAAAFREHRSDVQVSGEGVVRKVLADDTDGSRHQRFILQLSSGQTLLVAHNVDLAPRLPSLAAGDTVGFSGVYEWSPQGGVIHWTHHDPRGDHAAGWLEYDGQTYR